MPIYYFRYIKSAKHKEQNIFIAFFIGMRNIIHSHITYIFYLQICYYAEIVKSFCISDYYLYIKLSIYFSRKIY